MGASVIGISLLLQRCRRSLPASLTAGLLAVSFLVVLGAPQLGSNFGGFLAALLAFSYTFLRLRGVRLRAGRACAFGLLVFLVCFGLLYLDYLRPPEARSHFGQLLAAVAAEGPGAAGDVIVRKLTMNYRLIKYTIWTRVLIGTLLALGILFYRPLGFFRGIKEHYPRVALGLEGCLVGALAALVCNDSGIVAAATGLIFPATTLTYLALWDLGS